VKQQPNILKNMIYQLWQTLMVTLIIFLKGSISHHKIAINSVNSTSSGGDLVETIF